jgi:hypothetical protein
VTLPTSLRRTVSISVLTEVLARTSVKLINTSSADQPSLDPGIFERPSIHDAADDRIWTRAGSSPAYDLDEHRSHVRFFGRQPATRNVRISSWAAARLF